MDHDPLPQSTALGTKATPSEVLSRLKNNANLIKDGAEWQLSQQQEYPLLVVTREQKEQAQAEMDKALSKGKTIDKPDVADDPRLQAIIEKHPQFRREILELARLFTHPALYNCRFEGDKVFYTDPDTQEERELRRLNSESIRQGTNRNTYEGPVPGTVIKVGKPGTTGAYQSANEIVSFVQASDDARQNLIEIFGARQILQPGSGIFRIALLEQAVTPLGDGEVSDINFLKQHITNAMYQEEARRHFLSDKIQDLENIQKLADWGKNVFQIIDWSTPNIGRTNDGRYVYYDFGARRNSKEKVEITELIDNPTYGINFNALRG
jgi:hypothetical protein